MIDYLTFKEKFNEINGESEIKIILKNREDTYMIIKYDNYITFQRIGDLEKQSGEIRFDSLDDLYNSITIDNICLKKEWNNIEDIIIDDWLSLKK